MSKSTVTMPWEEVAELASSTLAACDKLNEIEAQRFTQATLDFQNRMRKFIGLKPLTFEAMEQKIKDRKAKAGEPWPPRYCRYNEDLAEEMLRAAAVKHSININVDELDSLKFPVQQIKRVEFVDRLKKLDEKAKQEAIQSRAAEERIWNEQSWCDT